MKSISLSLEESQLVIEALLFTVGADVCSDHTDVHRAKMLTLAESINNKFDKPALHNIYLYKDSFVADPNTSLILEKFTNVPLNDIISDLK
jgi:hypothetical protein